MVPRVAASAASCFVLADIDATNSFRVPMAVTASACALVAPNPPVMSANTCSEFTEMDSFAACLAAATPRSLARVHSVSRRAFSWPASLVLVSLNSRRHVSKSASRTASASRVFVCSSRSSSSAFSSSSAPVAFAFKAVSALLVTQ